jgi:hypothetical protein
MSDEPQAASGYRVYYVTAAPEGGSKEQRRPGPSFATLEEAIEHVASMVGEVSCDIRLPDGRWYAKEKTMLQPVDPSSKAGKAAAEAVDWMKSRPSRSSPGKAPKG